MTAEGQGRHYDEQGPPHEIGGDQDRPPPDPIDEYPRQQAEEHVRNHRAALTTPVSIAVPCRSITTSALIATEVKYVPNSDTDDANQNRAYPGTALRESVIPFDMTHLHHDAWTGEGIVTPVEMSRRIGLRSEGSASTCTRSNQSNSTGVAERTVCR
ncbi:hypothetical protein ABIB25_005740 [Nakamurella sp. UYEF19]|uniref:hypothetical protein n=1 Tax=Nakamurella sp. UYEF19 TaxID=1756392 RepID=UPI003390EB54